LINQAFEFREISEIREVKMEITARGLLRSFRDHRLFFGSPSRMDLQPLRLNGNYTVWTRFDVSDILEMIQEGNLETKDCVRVIEAAVRKLEECDAGAADLKLAELYFGTRMRRSSRDLARRLRVAGDISEAG
jgi:hypothetical protein